MNNPTQRTFQDIETKEVFRLYRDSDTHAFSLISDTTKVNGFYISAHSPITIKIDNKKQIKLPRGTFYNLKYGEVITHKKYAGFKKFTKI